MKRNYKHILFPFVLCGLMAAQTSAAPGIVKGRITDTQGKPVAQVVVTDGRNFTTTDGTGHYRMESDAERQPLVYISTPSAYKLPATDGIADRFYQFQKADSQENTCNFTLEPREPPPRRFVYIAISDPQVKTDAHLDRFRKETVPDLKCTVDSFKGQEVVGMAVGDLVWDAMNLVEPYKECVSHLGLTMFQAIGNPLHALINSVCRQLVVLLPAAWLLAQSGKLELVWFCFPIAEIFSFILSAVFLRETLKTANARMLADG